MKCKIRLHLKLKQEIISNSFSKLYNSEFSYIELWFHDQSSKLLEIEDKINITLVNN